MLFAFGHLVIGFLILAIGGQAIVRGAISVALLARVSTAIVGLTVVAFGTSLPELAVTVNAASQGATDISYANVVGSNIFNIAVILGIVVLMRPVPVGSDTLYFQYPGMFAVLALMVLLARDGIIDRFDGLFLLAAMGLFLFYTVREARRGRQLAEAVEHEKEVVRAGRIKGSPFRSWSISLALVAVGIFFLWLGADFMVRGAVSVARIYGVSERIIGLTIIAMGTSLPELAATVAASRHGESALILGNLMGSNIFNVLGILGTTAIIFDVPVHPRAAALDNWVMLAFGAVLFPIMATKKSVSRLDGALLLMGFAAYLVALFVKH